MPAGGGPPRNGRQDAVPFREASTLTRPAAGLSRGERREREARSRFARAVPNSIGSMASFARSADGKAKVCHGLRRRILGGKSEI